MWRCRCAFYIQHAALRTSALTRPTCHQSRRICTAALIGVIARRSIPIHDRRINQWNQQGATQQAQINLKNGFFVTPFTEDKEALIISARLINMKMLSKYI